MANALRVPYAILYTAGGEAVQRSMLPLILTLGDQSVDSVGLVDSGADVNVLPYQIGLKLGARWDAQSTSILLSGNLADYEARGLILSA